MSDATNRSVGRPREGEAPAEPGASAARQEPRPPEDGLVVTPDGIRWEAPPQHREQLFDERGLRLDEWLRNGQALKISGLQAGLRALYRADGALIGLGRAQAEGELRALRLTQAADKHRKTL